MVGTGVGLSGTKHSGRLARGEGPLRASLRVLLEGPGSQAGRHWEPGQGRLGVGGSQARGGWGARAVQRGVVAGRGTRWRCGAGPGAAGPHLPAAAPGGAQRGNPAKTQ